MTVLEHLQSLVSALEAEGISVHLVSVTDPNPTYPYVLLWPTTGAEFSDALCDHHGEISFDLGVTAAGLTAESVLIINQRVRRLLRSPWQVPGWVVNEPSLGQSQVVQVDTDVTLSTDGRHPFFAVDIWGISSQTNHK